MAGYVHFTEEQKQRANAVDLVYFLQAQGEKLEPSGRDKRLESDHSITVRGNRWYDHAAEEGGYAIDLVKRLYGLPFPDAVSLLLNGEQGVPYQSYDNQVKDERKPFALPEAHIDMRRMYAYLMKQRYIDRNVIYECSKEKLIYEDKDYHNIVFVGKDEQGIPRHAHKKSTWTIGNGFRGNVEGSDPAYSFHYISKNPEADKLFVFEAPIDLLSYISMNQIGWRDFHYVALNGVSDKPVLKLLELYPQITHVVLGMDHDSAGIEASEKLYDLLKNRGVSMVKVIQPVMKDWNEDLKVRNGVTAIPAEPHPQHLILKDVYSRIREAVEIMSDADCSLENIASHYERCQRYINKGDYEYAKAYFIDLAALSVLAAAKEYAPVSEEVNLSTLQQRLKSCFRAYENRSKFENKQSDLSQCLKSLFLLQENGQTGSDCGQAFERLAMEFLKASILTERMIQKQSQAEGQNEIRAPAPSMAFA